MADYSKHLTKQWDWCNKYSELMGAEAFKKYVSEVYKMLLNMKPGAVFHIDKKVKPDNVDLFIKICCMFLYEQNASKAKKIITHTFNASCTQIKCEEWLSKKKTK